MSKVGPTTPAVDEIEVSVFGRGFGECIVCHTADGKWIIVDSLNTAEGEPVALAYLRAIGVSPTEVAAIICTHWHDDHVRGAAALVQQCPNATVTFPITLCRDEFKQLLRTYGRMITGRFTNGVDELLKILETLKDQKHRLRFAIANKVLMEDGTVRVDSLSPSDVDVEKFLVAIDEWANETDEDRRLSKPRRNDTSVVVVVKISDELILLGGDLEVRDALSGWQAVHEIAWGARGKARVFKVAHHGSKTGDYDAIWTDLLQPNALLVLSPYNRGHKLPSAADVARLCGRSANAYSASNLKQRKGSRQNRTVERTLEEANIRLVRMPAEIGQVRLRKPSGSSDWEVALFDSACPLHEPAA